jgi:SAM-dependent methyltransferase
MVEERGELAGHPDQERWNARYAGSTPSFRPHPLAEQVLGPLPAGPVRAGPVPAGPAPAGPDLLGGPVPDGPVADLACGPSGSALLAAARGRLVTAVDVSAVALGLLDQEARRRGLAGRITLVHADLASWRPDPAGYALVLCTGFWDPAVFAVAVRATKPGGVLGWEAFTVAARQARPTLNPAWCLGPGEPAALLPSGFTVLTQPDVPGQDHGDRRRLLARRPAHP